MTNRFKYIGHNRAVKYAVWIMILCLLMGSVWWMTHRGKAASSSQSSLPLIQVQEIEPADMKRTIILSGETVPESQTDIAPKYSGRIASVDVRLGDRVETGQVLIRQDMRDLDISIAANQAGTEAAQASAVETRASYGGNTSSAKVAYDNALTEYGRYQMLYSEGAVSRQDLDNKYQTMAQAKASWEALENQSYGSQPAIIAQKEAAARQSAYNVSGLEQQRDDMTIRAPGNGMIGYRSAEPGEWASAGQKLLTIVDNSHIYVDCSVAEQDVGILYVGFPVSVSIDSLGKSYQGTIVYISPAMDSTTKSYQTRISLDTSDGLLRGGMFARAEISAVQRRNALYVPKQAVLRDNGKTYVYLSDGSGKVTKKEVTAGLSNDTSIEIIQGIQAGDCIAVTNISKLKDGGSVRIDTASGGQS